MIKYLGEIIHEDSSCNFGGVRWEIQILPSKRSQISWGPSLFSWNREEVNMDIAVEDLPTLLERFSTLQNL